MKPPFPGMDPYLEGADWQDVHNSLAYVIKRQLQPQLHPRYFAQLEKYVVEDSEAQGGLSVVYPDLNVMQKPPNMAEEPSATYQSAKPTTTPPTATIPPLVTVQRNIPVVQIKDKQNNRLVTTVEILSPANKRKPGLEKYREKQVELGEQGIHLLEIDLLRAGQRRLGHPMAASAHYLVSLARDGKTGIDIWAIDLKDTLPIVPVPLLAPDADVVLDLQKAFLEMYQEGMYASHIKYDSAPPPPVFTPVEQQWIAEILKEKTTP